MFSSFSLDCRDSLSQANTAGKKNCFLGSLISHVGHMYYTTYFGAKLFPLDNSKLKLSELACKILPRSGVCKTPKTAI